MPENEWPPTIRNCGNNPSELSVVTYTGCIREHCDLSHLISPLHLITLDNTLWTKSYLQMITWSNCIPLIHLIMQNHWSYLSYVIRVCACHVSYWPSWVWQKNCLTKACHYFIANICTKIILMVVTYRFEIITFSIKTCLHWIAHSWIKNIH